MGKINPYFEASEFEYMPRHLDLLFKAGLATQQRHDEDLDSQYKLQTMLGQVKAIDEHQPFKKALDEKWSGRLNDIVGKIQTGDKSARYDLMRARNDWQIDPIRTELEESYNQYGADQKKKLDLGAKYSEWGNPNRGFRGTLDDGNINPYRSKPFYEKQDHQKRAEEMMNDIKPSGSVKEAFNLDEYGNIVSIKEGYEGIADKWVRTLAKAKAGDFLSTIEGEDWLRENQFYQGAMGNPEDYLYRAGANQIFSKGTEGTDFDYAPQDIRELRGLNYEYSDLGAVVPDSHKDKYRVSTPVAPALKEALDNLAGESTGMSMSGPGPIRGTVNPRIKGISQGPLSKEQEVLLNKAKTLYGRGIADDNTEGKAKAINDYVDWWYNNIVSFSTYANTDPKIIKNENQRFFGSEDTGALQASNREFKKISGEGKELNTGHDIFTDYPKNEYSFNIVENLGPDNMYYPSARIVEITNKETGEPVAQYAMKGDKQSTDHNRFIHEMYKVKYNSPTGEYSFNIGGKKYDMKYEIIANQLDDEGNPIKEKEKVTIKTIVTDKNGNKRPVSVEKEVPEGIDAIQLLYNEINANQQ